jgi:hypothetical protein
VRFARTSRSFSTQVLTKLSELAQPRGKGLVNTHVSTSVVFFLLAALVPQAQERSRSLLAEAKEQGTSATNSIDIDYPVLSQLQLLSESDLVLRGRIVAAKALLREDESWVVINYEIAPVYVVKQTAPMNTARPGEVIPIVLRILGGTVVVDGRYRLTTVVPDFPESETPKLGEEMIFFMRYSIDEQGAVDKKMFNLTNGPFGIFRILNGHVQALRSAAAEKLGSKSMTVEVYLSDLQRKLSK